MKRGLRLDPKHAQSFNEHAVKGHFKFLKSLIIKKQIPPENIYNEDEKGIQLGGGGRTSPSNKSFLAMIMQGILHGWIPWSW